MVPNLIVTICSRLEVPWVAALLVLAKMINMIMFIFDLTPKALIG